MKTKHWIFFLAVLVLASCQNDDLVIDLDAENSIDANGSLASLISRTNQNPTALDDFLDESSATKIEFPFQVSIDDGNLIQLNNFQDYQLVIDELQGLGSDYSVQFQYPIQVALVDYETLAVSSQEILESLATTAINSSEINCVDFNFPIELNVFNLENETIETRNLSNKAQLYNFIRQLQIENAFFEFSYPFAIDVNNASVSINSLTELESVFTNLDVSCFNPNLFESDLINNDLEEFIVNESFMVISYMDEGEDESEDFEDLIFTFLPDGNISVINTQSQENFSGLWGITTEDEELELSLEFSDALLSELNEDWVVNSFSNNQLSLQDENDVLIFDKN